MRIAISGIFPTNGVLWVENFATVVVLIGSLVAAAQGIGSVGALLFAPFGLDWPAGFQ